MLVATVAEAAPTVILNPEPSQAEEKDPGPEPSKTMEGADGKAVEIRITLDPDEDGVIKILSAIILQENLPAPSPPRELNLKAPCKEEALAPIEKAAARGRRFCISPLTLLAALIVGFGVRARFHEQPWPDAPPQLKVS
jgi:hypothetical protein